MEKSDVKRFLQSLGCEGIMVSEVSDWVRSNCPLALYQHKKGIDQKGSFGIRASNSGGVIPVYHCFECGDKGTLPELVRKLHLISGGRMQYEDACLILREFNFGQAETEIRGRKRRAFRSKLISKKLQLVKRMERRPVPPEVLDQYPLLVESDSPESEQVISWLAEEYGISLQLIALYSLRLYVSSDSARIGVVFPIMDRAGMVMDLYAQVLGEETRFKVTPKMANSPEPFVGEGLWFGSQFHDPNRSVVLVEDPMDALHLRSAIGLGRVLASCGEKPTEAQLADLPYKTIYFAFSMYPSGLRNTKKAMKAIRHPRTYYLRWEEVGIKCAKEIRDKAQFRRVFDNRIKIEFPE